MNYLLEAFRQSIYAIGNSDPNPPVGAIIVDPDGCIIGKGFTQVPGSSHAEIMAIKDAKKKSGSEKLTGCTLYVTLEPCSHYGRTPPCTNAIIESDIKKVVIGARDQTEKVQGIEVLTSKNIEVVIEDSSRIEDQLLWTIDGFHYAEKNKKPRVFLKWAQTSEGWLAPPKGSSGDISGETSHEVIFRLRKLFHSILATPGTVYYDRPRLTPRYGGVSLDGKLNKDFFSEILLSFEKDYPELYRGIQNRFLMLPEISRQWSQEDFLSYAAMQNQLPGKAYFIVCNDNMLNDLLNLGYSAHYQIDLTNLDETLDYVSSMGTLNLIIEAGPVFSEVYFRSSQIDFLVASRSKNTKWNDGRGFSASYALANENRVFFSLHGFEIIYTAKLDSDDFFIFRKSKY